MITTGIMIILIVAASFGVTNYISNKEEERSLERLYEEAGDLKDTVQMYSKNDREELEMLSAVISRYQDLASPELWDLLDSYTNIGMMSRIELLLPGDVVLTEGGESVNAGGLLSFEDEAAKGIHITDREMDVIHKDTYVVRHYVPVKREGRTVAMLYGVIVPEEIPKKMNLTPYAGEGALYIIDGNTGDFLIDTWHPGTPGNLWELGEREMAPGYSSDQLEQGVTDGESQHIVFVSKTIGEYLYLYYEPMEINNWRIAVSVPESVVFESADRVERLLSLFLVVEMICFIMYFLWMMRYVRNVTDEKQKRLDTVNYMYDVEKLLFNAHEKKENVYAAMEKLASIFSAEKVSFWILEADGGVKWYLWETEKTPKERRKPSPQEYVRRLREFFESGNEVYESENEVEVRELFPAEELPDLYNVIAVPVESMEGTICGILAVCNVEGGHEQTALLKNIQFSFGMFCNNLKNFTDIRKRGERDALTGLYNRNRYERDLPRIYAKHRKSLACVYIDVNGLREMNNIKGHDQGDRMLRTVAGEIRKHFDTEYIYRTGGDEIVLFVPESDEADLETRSEALKGALSNADYYISVGIRGDRDIPDLSVLIQEAEHKMYVEKKRYYEKHDRRKSQKVTYMSEQ